jgi:hypothetical protein
LASVIRVAPQPGLEPGTYVQHSQKRFPQMRFDKNVLKRSRSTSRHEPELAYSQAHHQHVAGTVLEGLAYSGRPFRTRLDVGVAVARRTVPRISMLPVKAPF